MRKYNVNVNGTAYEVTVEEVKGAAPAPVAAPRSGSCPSSCSGPGCRTVRGKP